MTGTIPHPEDFVGLQPPKRKPGRPPVKDKRRSRDVLYNDAEWARVKAKAKAAGIGISEYVRSRTLD